MMQLMLNSTHRTVALAILLALFATPIRAAAQSAPTQTGNLDVLRAQALEEAEAGKTADAIRDYQRALQLQPNWKEGLWNLGMLQYDSSQFAPAKATFQKVVKFAPGLGTAWSLLGLSEYETADYDDALVHLDKAQRLGIQDDEIARVSSYHLALLLIRASDFERASALLQASFGAQSSVAVPTQARIAFGLALLRVPLLPEQLDPSREALVLAAGEAATSSQDAQPARLAALLQNNFSLPYLHLAYGLALAKTTKTAEAIQQFRVETAISPDSPLPWIELARAQMSQGAVNESLHAAQKALALAPGNLEARRLFDQAWIAASLKEKSAAQRKLSAPTAVVPLAPEQRILHLYADPNAGAKAVTPPQANLERWDQALLEFTQGQYASARDDFKNSLAVKPDNGNGWALLGICEYELKDYDNAFIHLDRSAKLGVAAKPEYLFLARYTYGILLIHAARFDEAADVLATATGASGPLADKVQFALGLALLRRAEFPEAVSPAEAALIPAAGQIAELLEKSDYDKAFPQFKTLLEKYPLAPFLHYAYGTALVALSNFDQAAAQMQAETVISPRSELPCASLASIALRQHDAPTALTWAQKALAIAPDSVDAHYLLGRASLESGDLGAAIRELELAAKLSPASPEIHFNLAKAYARNKQPEKAQQERDIFSALNQSQKTNATAPPPK
ncbi:MAG: tetratricopeptide repeat protein [Terracidiphilus sp.]|jgi:tetratricopeptide (TPR) repeat protein